MSLTVKASYKNETRRFPIDASNATSFTFFEEKIRRSFSELPARGELVIQWKDIEGDLVAFSSDEELIEALGSVDNGIFKVFLTRRGSNDRESNAIPDFEAFVGHLGKNLSGLGIPNIGQSFAGCDQKDSREIRHFGVTCDGCDMHPIEGKRFKCETCPNYDLCSNCKTKGLHSEHSFTEIEKPVVFHPFWKSRVGPGFCEMQSKFSKAKFGKINCPYGVFDEEERTKVQEIVEKVKELAVGETSKVANSEAAECVSDSVAVAIRSSIHRAVLIHGKSGLDAKKAKKAKKTKRDADSSESSTESDEEQSSKKVVNKKAKAAVKRVQQVVFAEVNEEFGQLAAKWASHSIAESMLHSIKMCGKSQTKQPKEAEAGCSMDADRGLSGPCPEPDDFVGEEERAVLDAIAAFKIMGFTPDEKLIGDIRKAAGNIAAVFENMKKC